MTGSRGTQRQGKRLFNLPERCRYSPLPSVLRGGTQIVTEAIITIKRTKSATKRTSGPPKVRETQGRALHSFFLDILDLSLCRPCPDGRSINTDSPISLASGRSLSRATLFRVLNLGGWTAFGTFVWALNIAE